MILDQRVFHERGGVFTDISVLVNDFRIGDYVFPYEVGDHLYIASLAPFNNIWFELAELNVVADAVPTVEMWWGNSWAEAVDVIDQTGGLTSSNRLQWNTDFFKGWDRSQRSAEIPALITLNIYNMFWVRISWDKNLTPTTKISYIGQRFSNDEILYSFYPDLVNLKTAYQQGKTNWNEQHYMAAEQVVRDLRTRNIIANRGQILDHELFINAACHKVAEIVYAGCGKAYTEQHKQARVAYNEALNIKFYNVDKFMDGRLEPADSRFSTGYLSR